MKNTVKKPLRNIAAKTAPKKSDKNLTVGKTEKTAVKSEKSDTAEKPKKSRVNVFGAGSQRPNRKTTGISEMGNRKWVFRAVVKTGKNGEITRADTVENFNKPSDAFVRYETADAARAAATLAKTKNADIVNARAWKRDGAFALWVAFSDDNGKPAPIAA